MAEPHISLDPQGLSPVPKKLRAPLQEQLTSAFRAATARVQAGYAGESVEQVSAHLLAETREGLHPDIAAGFTLDHTELRQVAERIVGS